MYQMKPYKKFQVVTRLLQRLVYKMAFHRIDNFTMENIPHLEDDFQNGVCMKKPTGYETIRIEIVLAPVPGGKKPYKPPHWAHKV